MGPVQGDSAGRTACAALGTGTQADFSTPQRLPSSQARAGQQHSSSPAAVDKNMVHAPQQKHATDSAGGLTSPFGTEHLLPRAEGTN